MSLEDFLSFNVKTSDTCIMCMILHSSRIFSSRQACVVLKANVDFFFLSLLLVYVQVIVHVTFLGVGHLLFLLIPTFCF